MKHFLLCFSISTLAILLPALISPDFELLYLCSLIVTSITVFFYSRKYHQKNRYVPILALSLPPAISLPYFSQYSATGLASIYVLTYIGFLIFVILLGQLLGNFKRNENGIKYLLGIYLPFLLMVFSFPLGRSNQMVVGGLAYFIAGYFFIQWGNTLRKSAKSLAFAGLTMLPIVFIYTLPLLTQKYHSALPVVLVSICLFIIGGFFHGYRKRFPIYILLVCTVLIPFSRFAIPNVLSAKNQYPIPPKQKVEYLEFYTLDGDCWSTEDARGKYIVLDLWTTNCGICFKKFPVFEELYKKHKSEQTIFGAVHLPTYRDTETKVSTLINERLSPSYTFPVYRSHTDFYTYQSLFNIVGVPQILVIDKNSEVSYLGFGDCGGHIVANNLCNYLDEALN